MVNIPIRPVLHVGQGRKKLTHHVQLSSGHLPTGKNKVGSWAEDPLCERTITGGTTIVPSALGMGQRYWILILRTAPRTSHFILMSDGSPRITFPLFASCSFLIFIFSWYIFFCKSSSSLLLPYFHLFLLHVPFAHIPRFNFHLFSFKISEQGVLRLSFCLFLLYSKKKRASK